MVYIKEIRSLDELLKNKDKIKIEYSNWRNDYKHTIFYVNNFIFLLYKERDGIRITNHSWYISRLFKNDIVNQDNNLIQIDYFDFLIKAYEKAERYKKYIRDWVIRFDISEHSLTEIKEILNEVSSYTICYKDLRIQDRYWNFNDYVIRLNGKLIEKVNAWNKLSLEDYYSLKEDLIFLENKNELGDYSQYCYIYDINTIEKINNTFYRKQWNYFSLLYKNIPEWYTTIHWHWTYIYNIKNDLYLCSECWEYHLNWEVCRFWQLDNYHSCTTPEYTTKWKKSKIRLWFEVEKQEILDTKHIIELKKNKWRAEQDGSVNWWEYITPVLSIDEVKDYFEKFKFIFDYAVDSRCWWHIHFSSKEVKDTTTLYKQMSPFRPLLWAIFPTRASNSYSNKNSRLWEKYRDWNLRDETIEFRIFPWVEKMEDVLFRTEILRFIYNNRILNSNENDNYSLAKDIIKDKIWEILSIISIRYNKNTFNWILWRLQEYYGLEDNPRKEEIIIQNNLTNNNI